MADDVLLVTMVPGAKASAAKARLAQAISQLTSGLNLCDLANTFQELLAKLAKGNMMLSGS